MRVTICLFVCLLMAAAGCARTSGASPPVPSTRVSASPDRFPDLTEMRERAGIRFRDSVVGTGPEPSGKMLLTIEYSAWTMDGRLVESTANRGESLTFMTAGDQVIRGLELGVRSMHLGGRRILVIPPALAYGGQGVEGVGSNETLVFDVRLIKVEKPSDEEAGEPY